MSGYFNDTNNRNSVVGLFRNRYEVEKAIKRLKEDGFRDSDICALWPTEKASRELVHKKTSRVAEGVSAGGLLGALLGFISFASVWALKYDTGSFFDFLLHSFAGAGFSGLLGSLIGFVFGSRTPRYEVKRYSGHANSNGLLVSTHVDNTEWQNKAIEDFKNCGAKDIGVIDEEDAFDDDSYSPPPKLRADFDRSQIYEWH